MYLLTTYNYYIWAEFVYAELTRHQLLYKFSGPHFRLPRFDSPLTTPSEVKINGRRILPVINYYIQNALFVKCLYPSLYPVI